jgi:hypothetical protein
MLSAHGGDGLFQAGQGIKKGRIVHMSKEDPKAMAHEITNHLHSHHQTSPFSWQASQTHLS